jgi:hypothetical protein
MDATLIASHDRDDFVSAVTNENGGGKVCHGSGGIVPQLAE